MGVKSIITNLLVSVKKYRYAVLVLMLGLVLMWMPDFDGSTADDATPSPEVSTDSVLLEERLSLLLSRVDGAGAVQVVLTVSAGEEVVYQTDSNESHHTDTSTIDTDTVTVTNADRGQTGLVRQKIPAVYQGAIVVCEGADDPNVRLSIVDAVSKITGLGANQIAVLKMK